MNSRKCASAFGTCSLVYLLACALGLLTVSSGYAQEIKIPAPINFVSDYANVIDDQIEAKLNDLLKELKDKTTAEVAVLTVKSTKPADIFDYGMKVTEQWGIRGSKLKDNGLLFLVASEDRELVMLTGYGLEGILPDVKLGEIRDRYVIPAFRENNYSEGIYKGTWVIAAIIAKDAAVELTGTPAFVNEKPSGLSFQALVMLIVVLVIVSSLWNMRARRYGPRRRRASWGGPIIIWGGSGSRIGRSGFGSGGFSRGSFGGFSGGGVRSGFGGGRRKRAMLIKQVRKFTS